MKELPIILEYGTQDESHATYFVKYINQIWVMWVYKTPRVLYGHPTKIALTPANGYAADCSYAVARDFADTIENILSNEVTGEVSVALIPGIFVAPSPTRNQDRTFN